MESCPEGLQTLPPVVTPAAAETTARTMQTGIVIDDGDRHVGLTVVAVQPQVSLSVTTVEGVTNHWEIETTPDENLVVKLRDWSRPEGNYPALGSIRLAVEPGSSSHVYVKRVES